MNIMSGMPIQMNNVSGVKAPEQAISGQDLTFSVDSSSQDQGQSQEQSGQSQIRKKAEGVEILFNGSGEAALTKNQAMWTFLDRMETELQVDPEDVVAAFAKMDVDMLMASPEDSAEEFVANLDLPPENQERAMSLYSELLTWRSTADLSQELKSQGQVAQVNVLSKDQAQKRDRIEQLNILSDKFFMQGEFSRGAKLAPMQNVVKAYTEAPGFKTMADLPVDTTKFDSNQLDVPEALQTIEPQAFDSEGFDLEVVQPNNGLQSQEWTPEDVEAALAKVSDFKSSTEVGDDLVALDSAVPDDTLTFESQSDSEQMDESPDDGLMAFARGADGKIQDSGKTFTVGAPEVTDMEMSENIREVIRGAQTMVKDGGGEMKIRLQPEGLGELNLKVMVKDGEVKVEMITSSDESKKLLEKGLADLKSSLNSHKLNVEHIKIETAQKAAEQMMQERQEASERNFQQRFLQDFRDQNAGRRFQTLGVSSARGLSSQTADGSMAEVEASARQKRLDRRLDLVA